MFAANEPGVLGAAEGLRRPGETGRIVLIGWDGSPLEEQELREGVINALVVQNPFEMGYRGVEAAVQKIRGNAEVEGQNTSVTLVTRDNVDDPEVQSVLHPSCDNPPT
ncbi:MAG: substrate-binding domain-containing protein [Actinomycetota bacterium]|nr:substrate-binding domain-containing protein [Actinomycetota bacterium]